jgi:hypothetical protein
MKLDMAYLYLDCKEIFIGANHGVCVVCTSGEVWPLSRLIQSAEEREDWFEKIKASKGGLLGQKIVAAGAL